MPVLENDTSKQLAVYFYLLKSHSTFNCHTPILVFQQNASCVEGSTILVR